MNRMSLLRAVTLGGVVAVAASLIVAPGAALATAPVPPSPADPTLMFEETYENGVSDAAFPLADYTGADGTTYTADPQWLLDSACNGIIVNSTATFTNAQCGGGGDPQGNVRALANALGGATNHAVTAYTHQGHPNDTAQTLLVKSDGSGITTQEGNFYVASIDVSEVNCVIGAYHSQIQFGLLTPPGEIVIDPATAVVCNEPGSGDTARTAKLVSDGFMPTAAQAGASEYIARNLATNGGGNDFAYDNLRFYEATPSLYKAFDTETVEVGQTVKMYFTVVNTSELSAKAGWSFDDNLPAGMTVAATPNVETTCAAADVTADAGAATISIANGTIARGVSDCQISLDVVLNEGGAFENVIEGATGLKGEPSATVTALVPHFTLVKTASPDPITASDNVVDYTFTVTNDGEVPLNDVTVADPGPVGGKGTMSTIDCPADTLAVDESITCTATYTIDTADLTGEALENTAVANATSPAGTQLTAEDTATIQTVAPAPAIELVKTATGGPATTVGQQITYSFEVTNTGNVDVTDVTVTEGEFTGKGELGDIVCPADETALLAVDDSVTCTATYTVVAADLTGKDIENTAVANATSPTGPVESNEAAATVPTVAPVPAIELVKTATGGPATTAGQQITYSFEVTNTGNVDVTDVTVTEGEFTGKGELGPITCPAEAALLAVDDSVTCTATYTVVAADLTGKDIENTAVANATSPTGPVESNEADATVPTVAPVIPTATPTPTPSTPGKLPTTGSESLLVPGGALALLILVAGASFLVSARRKQTS